LRAERLHERLAIGIERDIDVAVPADAVDGLFHLHRPGRSVRMMAAVLGHEADLLGGARSRDTSESIASFRGWPNWKAWNRPGLRFSGARRPAEITLAAGCTFSIRASNTPLPDPWCVE